MRLSEILKSIKNYIDGLQADESSDVCADIKRFKEVDDKLFELYYCEGVDKLIKICNDYAYHELDGSWIFWTSNSNSVKAKFRLHKISKFL